MGRKPDIRQVDQVSRRLGMDDEERDEFGRYLEMCKDVGDRGTVNSRGDFTWDELMRKGREFLGLDEEVGL